MPQKDTSKAVVTREESERLNNKKKGFNYLFVIAIDAYVHCPKLYNCINDAEGLIDILTTQYEFDAKYITTLFNEEATEGNIFKAFRKLITKVTAKDNVIIYFSGHGEYDEVFDEGYWIPVNARLGAHEDFVPNSKIKNILEAIKSKHTFLIADSCFSGSLFTQFKSAAVAERLENDPSRWGLTAGRNEVVSDGQMGDHSPFADSLLYHLKENEVPLGVATLCNRVIENVVASAEQTPRGEPLKVKGHRGGQFFFHPKNVKQPAPIKKPGQGSILYQIPDEMELGQDTKCVVRIAFEAAILRKELVITKETVIKDIKVSQLMEVELLDPLTTENFQIRSINEKEQIIDKNDFTQWLFYVKANKEGKFPLYLKVTVIELVYGKERKKEIVLEELVHVVTQLKQPKAIVFKNAGYALSFSLGNLKGLNEQILPAPIPTTNFGKERYSPIESTVEPTPIPLPSPKKQEEVEPRTRGRLYKISGGIAAILLFLVIGNTIINNSQKKVGNGTLNQTQPDREEVVEPGFVPEKTTNISNRNLRKEQNPNGNGKIGFRDINSKELVIDYLYDGSIPFNGPSTFVKKGSKWALIDKDGKLIVNFKIKQPGKFKDGYAEIIPVGKNRVIKMNHAGEVKFKGKFYKLEEILDQQKLN